MQAPARCCTDGKCCPPICSWIPIRTLHYSNCSSRNYIPYRSNCTLPGIVGYWRLHKLCLLFLLAIATLLCVEWFNLAEYSYLGLSEHDFVPLPSCAPAFQSLSIESFWSSTDFSIRSILDRKLLFPCWGKDYMAQLCYELICRAHIHSIPCPCSPLAGNKCQKALQPLAHCLGGDW